MSIIRTFLFLSLILIASCKENKVDLSVRTGDLIFVNNTQSDFSQAINDVTQVTEEFQYTHIGLIEVVKDSVFIIHASSDNGVERIPILDFLCTDDTVQPAYHVYRLDMKDIDYNAVVSQAKQFIGLPYNWSYELSDSSQYCSELIFNAFENYNVFTVEPMTFKNKNSDEFNPVWVDFFKKRNQSIPEGALGCNPNGLSQNKNLKIIFGATCNDTKSVQFYNFEKRNV